MDVDKDGELQAGELRDFIGAQLGTTDFNTGRKLDRAIAQVTGKLDGADSGLDISVNELDQHLHKVLEGVKVWEWITHSLGLPMYAEAFRDNAITVHDFPMLVSNGGQLLQAELLVVSLLHRQKIIRAMQRQMLGLGAEPGPIPHLSCNSTTTTSSSSSSSSSSIVQCIWRPPSTPGEPPLHKYVLERFALAPPSPVAAWQPVAELDDLVVTRFSDAVGEPGSYQYRVAAWNLYGRSPYAFSDEVVVERVLGGPGSSSRYEAAAAAAALCTPWVHSAV
ncbi:hypothetical protein OEZ85_003927 [Tetradesmus obliquus]|uniref:EF-hand domain-containing protein n=1 Tax=Tetradesmus obliquus TaxID=3088 RepID=A0ABY8UG47_TETOB|nr:hypothetical protein OEZ85_003927 [Tetradesmus obliquus]